MGLGAAGPQLAASLRSYLLLVRENLVRCDPVGHSMVSYSHSSISLVSIIRKQLLTALFFQWHISWPPAYNEDAADDRRGAHFEFPDIRLLRRTARQTRYAPGLPPTAQLRHVLNDNFSRIDIRGDSGGRSSQDSFTSSDMVYIVGGTQPVGPPSFQQLTNIDPLGDSGIMGCTRLSAARLSRSEPFAESQATSMIGAVSTPECLDLRRCVGRHGKLDMFPAYPSSPN
jgi:hypothetical protein